MTRERRVIVLGAIAAVAGAVAASALSRRRARTQRDDAVGALAEAPAFHDLEGRPRTLADWRGHVVLLNFWATWCAPCREEIPALMEVRKSLAEKVFEVVGIAIDSPDKVRGYAADMRISYPVLLADMSAIQWMQRLGNRAGALPYSVVLSRSGNIAAQHLGLLTARSATALVAPALSL